MEERWEAASSQFTFTFSNKPNNPLTSITIIVYCQHYEKTNSVILKHHGHKKMDC